VRAYAGLGHPFEIVDSEDDSRSFFGMCESSQTSLEPDSSHFEGQDFGAGLASQPFPGSGTQLSFGVKISRVAGENWVYGLNIHTGSCYDQPSDWEECVIEIGAFDARDKFSRLLDQVQLGEEVVIMRRGKPVARLVPNNLSNAQANGNKEQSWEQTDGAEAAPVTTSNSH
jgi:prevent-host-death family protein